MTARARPLPASDRLRYREVRAEDRDALHAILADDHVREYLLVGATPTREWVADEIAASERLFAERGVGLFVARLDGPGDAGDVGFCGFRTYDEIEPHPHLLYGLLPRATGRGLATEMARALVEHATRVGFGPLRASVDEVNAASMRVLEKVGFRRYATLPGAFGPMHLLELAADKG